MIEANRPDLQSWVNVPADSDFPIQNLPFGIFSTPDHSPRPGVAIGDQILDLHAVAERGLIDGLGCERTDFAQSTLNAFIERGKAATRAVRGCVSELLREGSDLAADASSVLVAQADATLHLPVHIGDYTDFYSSEDHARNVGKMFRDPDNALLPNWKHIPVGYHGRASSIVVSGTPIKRPHGQTKPNDTEPPVFGPSRLLDFELEMAFVTHPGKPLGETISTAEADDYIFGLAFFNDWSARDIQKWEYVPLGPFLGKNFGSSMSPWIVTLDALEPYRVPGPVQDPEVLPYLAYEGDAHYDVALQVDIIPESGEAKPCANPTSSTCTGTCANSSPTTPSMAATSAAAMSWRPAPSAARNPDHSVRCWKSVGAAPNPFRCPTAPSANSSSTGTRSA